MGEAWPAFWRALNDGHRGFTEQNSGVPGVRLAVLKNPASGLSLYVHTSEEEITVGVQEWQWHWHWGTFLDLAEDEVVSSALKMVEGIVTEQQVLHTVRRGGRHVNSGLVYLAAPLDHEPGCTLSVRSWSGTFAQDLPA